MVKNSEGGFSFEDQNRYCRVRQLGTRRGDRVDVQDDARGDQIFKLILIIGEPLAAFILDILKDHALFLALNGSIKSDSRLVSSGFDDLIKTVKCTTTYEKNIFDF